MITPLLLAEVQPLAQRFVAAGFRIYLVGGIVRDQLLGKQLGKHTDIDLTTDATPGETKRVLAGLADAIWSQGERFGTVGCRIGARDYEITTHRGESYQPQSRKPAVVFSSELRHDLERRDFTVNAMAIEVPAGELFDPFDGAADLANRVLRTPLNPDVSFSDDPLRMLRAARFVAGYGLVPRAPLVSALVDLAPRMGIVSVERRRDELDKLLAIDDPGVGLHFLRQHGLIEFVVPSLADVDSDLFDSGVEVIGNLPKQRELRLAALLAVGRPSRRDVERWVRDLRYGNDVISSVGAIVLGASIIQSHEGEWRVADVRRLVAAVGKEVDAAIVLASTRTDVNRLTDVVARLRAAEDLDALDSALDGDDVMTLLGLAPGAEVGRALAFVRELRIVEGPLDPDEARRRLLAWWGDQSSR